MKGAQGKFGGSFSETMVKINFNNISLPHFFTKFQPLIVLNVDFALAVGETVEIGNFDPKIATFWIESGNCFLSSSV